MLNTSGEDPGFRSCQTGCCVFTHLSHCGALEGLCAVLPAPLAAPSRVSSTALVHGARAGQLGPAIRARQLAEGEV